MVSADVLWKRLPGVLAKASISDEDLEHLDDQMGFLDDSCVRYDAGVRREYKRLAAAIRILVHDSDASTSLLSRIGLKSVMPWVDGSRPGEPTRVREQRLNGVIPVVSMLTVHHVEMASIDVVRDVYIAPAFMAEDLGRLWVGFSYWWGSPRIYGVPDIALSRRDLVLHVANKNGGAHVDDLPRELHAIDREGAAGGLLSNLPGKTARDDSPVPAAIRQIAEEVRFTIRSTLHERISGDLEASVPQPDAAARPAN